MTSLTNSTHDSRCNPSKNANLLISCCSHLGPAVGAYHIHGVLPKHPGSNILMLDHYRGLWLAGWWWRHILLLRKLLSKLTPGKLFILKNLPDQETPGVTSHGLGRVGVGLPCCLCLSFPQISATT